FYEKQDNFALCGISLKSDFHNAEELTRVYIGGAGVDKIKGVEGGGRRVGAAASAAAAASGRRIPAPAESVAR
ncbi:MAG: hypothetical protein K2I40_03735, partial [Bifidobacterium castoris]|nr:hypothetical protein [Bifidobacterium castoris]